MLLPSRLQEQVGFSLIRILLKRVTKEVCEQQKTYQGPIVLVLSHQVSNVGFFLHLDPPCSSLCELQCTSGSADSAPSIHNSH